MGAFSFGHILLVVIIVLIVFGAGKLPAVMGDLAKGVKNFKKGLQDDDNDTKPSDPAK
jgi:sec-independent protein translocase protein TatA